MKKVALLSLVVVVAMGLAGVASAHMWGYGGGGPGYYGMGPGMIYGYGGGPGMMYGYDNTGNTVSVEKFKQFQKDTAALRDELAVKQIELNGEYTKDDPDSSRIATLQKDIESLQTRIAKAADKAGIDTDRGPGRGRRFGGYGMMYGNGYGCAW